MASSHGAPPVFNNKVVAWIDHRLPIFSYIEKEYHTFPTPPVTRRARPSG